MPQLSRVYAASRQNRNMNTAGDLMQILTLNTHNCENNLIQIHHIYSTEKILQEISCITFEQRLQ